MEAVHRIAVLISGNGSNLQAIIDAISEGRIANARISLVVSNRQNAYGLNRAKEANIPIRVFPLKNYKDAGKSRIDYDRDLASLIASEAPSLVVLAGWMHILSSAFLDRFPRKVINLHPALPGAFDGAHAIERAYESFKEGTIKSTGAMVHYVIPEVDRGEPIIVREIPILENDDLTQLQERIHEVEHELLIEAIQTALKQ